MTFILSSAVNGCRYGREEICSLNLSDKGALLCDVALLVSAVVAGSLLLSGVLTPPMASPIAWSVLGLGGSIILADSAAAILRVVFRPPSVAILSKSFFEALSKTNPPSQEQIDKSKNNPCQNIWFDLYLGNSQAFAQTAPFACQFFGVGATVGTPLEVGNPEQFDTVISVCPLSNIHGDFSDLVEKEESDFVGAFKEQGITWIQVGKALADKEGAFLVLVHDCTYPDSELTKIAIDPGMTVDALTELCEEKQEVIEKVSVETWFEPVFLEIDKAFRKEKKVLVHCQAGRSRSTTLLAAYLINRYRVTPEVAVAFLKRRRPCIDPKFMDELNDYATRLGVIESEDSDSELED